MGKKSYWSSIIRGITFWGLGRYFSLCSNFNYMPRRKFFTGGLISLAERTNKTEQDFRFHFNIRLCLVFFLIRKRMNWWLEFNPLSLTIDVHNIHHEKPTTQNGKRRNNRDPINESITKNDCVNRGNSRFSLLHNQKQEEVGKILVVRKRRKPF